MFEKEAEKYVNNLKNEWQKMGEKLENWNELCFKVARLSFIDGAQFGYNKANEWHYVKDGDLPDEDVYVYLLFRGQEYPTVARRHLFKEWGRLKWCWDCKWGSGYTIEADNDRIIAWKEIVLPKEIEK